MEPRLDSAIRLVAANSGLSGVRSKVPQRLEHRVVCLGSDWTQYGIGTWLSDEGRHGVREGKEDHRAGHERATAGTRSRRRRLSHHGAPSRDAVRIGKRSRVVPVRKPTLYRTPTGRLSSQKLAFRDPVDLDPQRQVLSGADGPVREHVLRRETTYIGEPLGRHRDETADGRPIAELALPVVSPCPDSPIGE